MKMNSKFVVFFVALFSSFTVCATPPSKDCVSCTKKTIGEDVQPDKRAALELKNAVTTPIELASKSSLVITTKSEVGRSPAVEKSSKQELQDLYCMKFANIEWQSIASTIKEMEATPYPVDSYFLTASCQPAGYSEVVKSPISHIIADDPSKRENFLNIIWLYYSKKRNDPAKFVDMVNAKNTEGETLLDYIETMSRNGIYLSDGSKASVAKIISVACSHGAVYSAFPEKKCP